MHWPEGNRTEQRGPSIFEKLAFITVLLIALALVFSHGTSDVPLFLLWMRRILEKGIVEGYRENATPQPPFYAVLFFAVGRLAQLFSVSSFLGYKLSILLAWLLTGKSLQLWTKDRYLICFMLVLLIPNSIALGYFDIYLAPQLLISFWALREKRFGLFSLTFTIFVLTKGQAAILVPFVAAYVIITLLMVRPVRIREFLDVALPALLSLGIAFLIFGAEILHSAQRAVLDEFYSGNALNLPWIVTWILRTFEPTLFGELAPNGQVDYITPPQNVPLWFWTRLSFSMAYGIILVCFVRRLALQPDKAFPLLLRFLFLGYLSYFILNTGVHENHLFCGCLIAFLLFTQDATYFPEALYTAVALNFNMIFFFGLTGSGLGFSRVVGNLDVTVPLAALNLLFFFICAVRILSMDIISHDDASRVAHC